MRTAFKEKKIAITVLGLVTALALFGIFLAGMDISNPMIADTLMISYIVIPIVLLLAALYKFKRTQNMRFLTYAFSVLVSVVAVIPVFCFVVIFVVVLLFGMPVPS
jgi:hypothetical protein